MVQLFCPLRISWSGHNELRTMHQLEAAGNPLRLQGERLYSGLYANELLVRLLARDDPQAHLFAYYQVLLEALQQQNEATEVMLRRFERQLLDQLGYDIVLTQEQGSGAAINAAVSYDYVPLDGFVLATGTAVAGTLRVPGEVLLALAIDDYQAAEVRHYAKAISRAALTQLLGNRPLKSRELFQTTATILDSATQLTVKG
jgi:DNA repair protein RecO (recombination protein O)